MGERSNRPLPQHDAEWHGLHAVHDGQLHLLPRHDKEPHNELWPRWVGWAGRIREPILPYGGFAVDLLSDISWVIGWDIIFFFSLGFETDFTTNIRM